VPAPSQRLNEIPLICRKLIGFPGDWLRVTSTRRLLDLSQGRPPSLAKLKLSISDHTYAKQHLYRRGYAASRCGGDNPALAVWHALEANSSPGAREGAPTISDWDFESEQGEIDQDGPTWEQP
jgi:hypothetical protein